MRAEMKKIVIAFIILISISYGIEYSLRIKALGTDFAYLIPDYETDLYLDPEMIGAQSLAGFSLQDGALPLTVRLFTKRFGWCGQYWGSYAEDQDSFSDRYGKNYSITVKDLWMLDLQGKFWRFLTDEVWNIYNDGQYTYLYSYWGSLHFDSTSTIEYLFGASDSWQIRDNFKIITHSCVGIYFIDQIQLYYDDFNSYESLLLPFSGFIGFHYRKSGTPNDFTSCYLLTGGPTTTADMNNLPFSIWSHVDDGEILFTWFARTWIVKTGFAKGINIDDNGMFVIGLRDTFLLQSTLDIEDVTNNRGLRNVLSMPAALEYKVNNIVLRIGTHVNYAYTENKIWDYWNNTNTLRVYEKHSKHRLNWGYSFGLQWSVSENFSIDMYNNRYISDLDEWAIYLKYIFNLKKKGE
jgi:opacity protein-like surface antigen